MRFFAFNPKIWNARSTTITKIPPMKAGYKVHLLSVDNIDKPVKMRANTSVSMIPFRQPMDSLLVESASTPGSNEPAVVLTYKEHQLMLTLSEAQTRGIGLINAAAYAESEGALFKALCPNFKKGFGKPTKDAEVAIQALRLVRKERRSLPPGINPILGFNTQEPLVEINYNSFNVTLGLNETRHHAMALLEAAEAARFDAFWYKFGSEKIGLSRGQMTAVVEEYRLYKERYSVEKLFSL